MSILSDKCDRCGSKEHETIDCPHGILSDKCDKCGSTEHATSDCPHGILSDKCDKCGSKDHETADCPHGILSDKCDKCGSTEHATSDCPHGILSDKCDKCGSKDHATDDCPHGIFSSSNEPDSFRDDVEGEGGLSNDRKYDGYSERGSSTLGRKSGDYSKRESFTALSDFFTSTLLLAIPLVVSYGSLWCSESILKNAPYDGILETLFMVLAGLFFIVLSIPAIIINAVINSLF